MNTSRMEQEGIDYIDRNHMFKKKSKWEACVGSTYATHATSGHCERHVARFHDTGRQ